MKKYRVAQAVRSSCLRMWDSFCVEECEPGLGEITLFPEDERQTLVGFGGALTASAAFAFEKLESAEQEACLAALFGEEGLRYHLLRLTIGSCDFSPVMYDYGQKDDLSDFSLDYDDEHILPVLRQIQKYVQPEIVASCWSPIAKWKTNRDKKHGGALRKDCYEKHAAYMARYAQEMEKRGFPISIMTVQNEPEATQKWESCRYDEEEEGRMVLLLHALLPQTKIYVWDHNRDVIVRRCKKLFSNPRVEEAASGIAYHWYDKNCHDELRKVSSLYPNKPLLFTEGCIELNYVNRKYRITQEGNWEGAIRYAQNYIRDLNSGSTGFLDWNVLLDAQGGPNHVGNYCEAPLMLDEQNHWKKSSSYFAIKHLSYFFQPGAKIIKVESQKDVLACAAKNPNGDIALAILNLGNDCRHHVQLGGQSFAFSTKKNEIISIQLTENC